MQYLLTYKFGVRGPCLGGVQMRKSSGIVWTSTGGHGILLPSLGNAERSPWEAFMHYLQGIPLPTSPAKSTWILIWWIHPSPISAVHLGGIYPTSRPMVGRNGLTPIRGPHHPRQGSSTWPNSGQGEQMNPRARAWPGATRKDSLPQEDMVWGFSQEPMWLFCFTREEGGVDRGHGAEHEDVPRKQRGEVGGHGHLGGIFGTTESSNHLSQ